MIVATAGHVDHGKTLLIKALTGVDADRLPEEKKRGMTIDLGFAYLPVAAGETIGFVDVPGHERFIHNMLCGLAGIDFVLFIVAADDGPMPQTREHLAILDLLGVDKGAIAITKIDRVPPDCVAEVELEMAELLAGTSLAQAPMFPVSAITGAGVEALKQHLLDAARDCPSRPVNGHFRLAVDRCFTVAGAGLIVTGTAVSGLVEAGAQVRALLADVPARVRGIHAQNAASQTGRAGQRCALNLAGPDLKAETIVRGDWIVGGESPSPARKIDARLRVLADEKQALAHWTPVHVHLGATDVTGRVAVLEGSSIAAGESGLVQLVLDRPIGAWRGDRLIVRDQSAQRTIGGGQVVDVYPPARGRAKPERIAYLRAMNDDDHEAALTALLELASNGLDLERFARNRNLTVDETRELFASVPMRTVTGGSGLLGFSAQHWERLKAIALEMLAAWHRRMPDSAGPSEDRVFVGAPVRLPREASVALVAELAADGAVLKQGTAVRLPSHQTAMKPADAALWKKVAPVLDQSVSRPPTVAEVASVIGEDAKRIESFLVRVARQGLLVRLSPNRFFRPEALLRLAEMVEDTAKDNEQGLVTVKAFRDRSEIGRNLTVEVLEYFDRIKLTQRVGEARKILRPARGVLGGADGSGSV
jgi:selenocysteine-specific elongation factor